MTNEQKKILLEDLCCRLPYGVKIRVEYPFLEEKDWHSEDLYGLDLKREIIAGTSIRIEEFKPYLRPMSSMTVEEGERLEQIAKETLGDFMFEAEEDGGAIYHMDKWKTLSPAMFDYLNSIHIDYRGLIEMGLALEAPDGMYVPYSITSGDVIKPYLRPMSSMTVEERKELYANFGNSEEKAIEYFEACSR